MPSHPLVPSLIGRDQRDEAGFASVIMAVAMCICMLVLTSLLVKATGDVVLSVVSAP